MSKQSQIAALVAELEAATEAYEIADTNPTGMAEASEAAHRVADACVALRKARGRVSR